MIKIHHIGAVTTIPNWPQANTVAGLLDALGRWTLDPRMDMREPEEQHLPAFRSRAWGACTSRWDDTKKKIVYDATAPIYPDSQEATRYTGNFLGYSFGFTLDTDEPVLIAQLDAAIPENTARPEYLATVQLMHERAHAPAPRFARETARHPARRRRQRGGTAAVGHGPCALCRLRQHRGLRLQRAGVEAAAR